MMKLLILISLNTISFASKAQTVKDMDVQDLKYVATINGSKWQLSIEDKSKYSEAGIPQTRMGQVLIEGKEKSGAPMIKKISIPEFPNEDGAFMLSLQSLDEPLFLVVLNGGDLKETDRRVFLMSPMCDAPLAHVDARMEETADVTVVAGASDFKISYHDENGKHAEKTWVKPEGKSICGHGFR